MKVELYDNYDRKTPLKETLSLSENEQLYFLVDARNGVSAFRSTEFMPSQGLSGTYKIEIYAKNIEKVDYETDTGIKLNYQMEPKFTYKAKFESNESHLDWQDIILVQGNRRSFTYFRSVIKAEPMEATKYLDRLNNSLEHKEKILNDVVDSDSAYVDSSIRYVVFKEREFSDGKIYMGIIPVE